MLTNKVKVKEIRVFEIFFTI